MPPVGSYAQMLIDDISTGILPYGSREEKYTSLTPSDAKYERILAYALSQHSYYRQLDLVGESRSFIELVAGTVARFGNCVCEVVELKDPATADGKTVAFRLPKLNPLTVRKQGKLWKQFVPQENENLLELTLPLERLIVFDLPQQHRAYWQKMIESLKLLDLSFPDLTDRDSSRSPRNAFDYKAHHELLDQAILRITRDIGWDMRRNTPDGITEYYWLHRRLRFVKFRIELRDHIIDTLNVGLKTMRSLLGTESLIELQNLPTIVDVEQAEEDLRSGTRSVKEIIDRFRTI